MQEKGRKPKIRFDGYTDEWEKQRLEDIIQITMGQSPDGRTYSDTPSDYILVQGNADLCNGWVLPRVWTTQMTKKADAGDFIMSVRAPAGAMGKTAYDIVIGRGVAAIKGNEFNYQLLVKMDIDGYWKKLSSGSIFDSLSSDSIKNTDVVIPGEQEQEELGSLFQLFDNIICLQQQKYNQLLNMKQTLLEKMFPHDGAKVPEIRFDGFKGDWEQYRWFDTVLISRGMVDPKCGQYDDLPHIAPGNIESFTGQLFDNVKSVKEENLISGKFHFYPDDIIYGKINPQLGKYYFSKYEGLTSADAYVLNAQNGINQKFLFFIIQTQDFYDYTVSVSKRSGMPKINRDELNDYSLLAPCIEEQVKIGTFLMGIDDIIALQKHKIDQLKNIKQSFLDKMFVS